MKNIIIDAHAHSGPYYNFYTPKNTIEDMLVSMDNVNIDICCFTPNISLTNDISAGNKEVFNIVNNYPKRFKGYIGINPNYNEHIKSDLDKYINNENIIGIKIHHSCHNASITNKNYDYAYSYINEKKGVILFHTWDMETIKEIERISDKYSDASIIMGHFGAYEANMRYCGKLINNRDNVYGDSCLSFAQEGNIEWLVSLVGSKKLLFGSDTPFFDPRPNIGRIIYSDLTKVEKFNVLGLNMQRILRRIQK